MSSAQAHPADYPSFPNTYTDAGSMPAYACAITAPQ